MDKDTDLRYIKTEKLIKSVFLELMEEIGFQKITVRKLVERAEINRSTFYLHYTDKFALLHRIENDLFVTIKTAAISALADKIKKGDFDEETIMPLMLMASRYIYANNKLYSLLMSEKGDPSFTSRIGENIKTVLFEKQMLGLLTIPQKYAIAAVTGIISGLIGEWLKGGFHETPEEYVQIALKIVKNIPGNIFMHADSPAHSV
ncbi:MAG: TetR/AcrR family transcriptional regulator [Oscillospiraceae bacterium]